MRKPTPRQLAAAQGLEHYAPAKPCKRGHDSLRSVSNGACLACHRERTAAKRAGNREEYNRSMREYRRQNAEAITAINRKADAKRTENGQKALYLAEQRQNNPRYVARAALYRRLHHALNGAAKADSTMMLVGCTIQDLVAHIEAQWADDMNWDNYGLKGWHIDHIRPCASFDLLDPEQQRQCFHYTNLQPLWADENLKKSDKF